MVIFSFSKFRNGSVSSYFVLIIVIFRFTVLEFSPFRMFFQDCSQAFAFSVGTFLDSISRLTLLSGMWDSIRLVSLTTRSSQDSDKLSLCNA